MGKLFYHNNKINIIAAVLCFAMFVPAIAFADGITFSGVQNISAEATRPSGAVVSFTPTAEDASSTPLTVSCSPSSGTIFSLGTTTVLCSATDSSSSTSQATFNVVVKDTTPPVITPPAEQTFATTTFPAYPVLVSATATDTVDPNPTITYSPTSFPLGTTTVTWTSTDEAGNSSATTSQVIITNASSTPPTPVAVNLQIYNSTSTLFSGDINVSACAESPGSSTSTVNGYCAVTQAAQADRFSVGWQWFSFGAALTSAGGEGDWNNGPWFTTFSDGQPMSDSLSEHVLSSGENILVTDGPMPLEVSVSTTTPEVNSTTTVTVLGFNANNFDYEPVSGAGIGGIGVTTNASGTVGILATSTTPFPVSVSASGFLTSSPITISPVAASIESSPVSQIIGGGGGVSHTQFNIPSALTYLANKQNTDGSFNSSILTDWAAIAFSSEDSAGPLQKIKSYELSSSPTMSSVTDFERHAMALEALGINPYSGTSVNYIAPIVAAFDGTQIGSPSLDNDDIFALFPLVHAGYTANDPIIQKEAAFVVSRQGTDGSWDGNADLTAAAIQSLSPLYSLPGVSGALSRAIGYLNLTQQSDGGWGTIDSTSWVQTAINAINEGSNPTSESAWVSHGGYYPTDALAQAQQSDGAVQPVSDPLDMRIWSTSYAIVAASNKSWLSILGTFPKPSVASSGSGPSYVLPQVTSTSTPNVSSTSTPAVISTSTPVTDKGEVLGASTTSTTTTLIGLEKQLVALEFKANSCAFVFNNNLSSGMHGADVHDLQTVLNYMPMTEVAPIGPGSPGSETSYFGWDTRGAVATFQDLFADKILIPNGLASGNGYVGPSTRAVLNSLCSGQ